MSEDSDNSVLAPGGEETISNSNGEAPMVSSEAAVQINSHGDKEQLTQTNKKARTWKQWLPIIGGGLLLFLLVLVFLFFRAPTSAKVDPQSSVIPTPSESVGGGNFEHPGTIAVGSSANQPATGSEGAAGTNKIESTPTELPTPSPNEEASSSKMNDLDKRVAKLEADLAQLVELAKKASERRASLPIQKKNKQHPKVDSTSVPAAHPAQPQSAIHGEPFAEAGNIVWIEEEGGQVHSYRKLPSAE